MKYQWLNLITSLIVYGVILLGGLKLGHMTGLRQIHWVVDLALAVVLAILAFYSCIRTFVVLERRRKRLS